MKLILCFVFFLSGVAALIFEALWFRLAGLVLGNSIITAAIVMASFMGGLAIGSGLIAFLGHKIKYPIRFFAFLEFSIAVSGILLVFIFPHLSAVLIRVFRSFLDQPVQLNAIKTLSAVGLMIIPSAAMGATLPVLIKALYNKERNFGKVLGLLYGWNTLGAVLGVILNEVFFIEWFGIKGTAGLAAGCNIAAAITALMVFRKNKSTSKSADISPPVKIRFSLRLIKLLIASFLSGMIMLGLEVIWFRFLLLFMYGHSWNFAMMLATVLAGISCGGLLAAKLFSIQKDIHNFLIPIVALSGVFIGLLYRQFDVAYILLSGQSPYVMSIFCAFYLMFPVAFLSGIIFTMLGRAIYQEMPIETVSSGLLTQVNTIGAMFGAFIGGFLLLPNLGIEKSFAILASLYGVIIVLLFQRKVHFGSPDGKKINGAAIIVFLFAQCLFPYGMMEQTFTTLKIGEFYKKQAKRIALHEGDSETIQFFQIDLCNQPYYYELFTNSFTMGSTTVNNRRFAEYFVYLPAALHPNPIKALLIAYGCGSTAQALTNTKGLKNIEIVDISKGIIETSNVIFDNPKDNPVYDPRVKVHIEDARFFLQTTKEKFDIITGEPPPPKGSGIVSLYTQEYFQLIHDCLAEGGIVTYYLPSYRLKPSETKAILKAFSNVFENCSLWTGMGFEWTMMGIKGDLPKVSEAEFVRQWQDPDIVRELKMLGFDDPEEFGASFIADRNRICSWVKNSKPLVDNYPYRVSPHLVKQDEVVGEYLEFMHPDKAKDNFANSTQIQAIWPQKLHQSALNFFDANKVIAAIFHNLQPWVKNLHDCLTDLPRREKYILWALLSDLRAQQIIAEAGLSQKQTGDDFDKEAYRHLAAQEIMRKNYTQAERYYGLAEEKAGKINYNYYYLRMYLLAISGKRKQAEQLGWKFVNLFDVQKKIRADIVGDFWCWYDKDVVGSN